MSEVYEGDKDFVFVSYSHKDGAIALSVINALVQAGFRVWYDEGIEAGSEWPEYIADHVASCRCFVALVSASSIESHNCRREVNYAIDLGKDMLVVYLEGVNLSRGMRMQLGIIHALYRNKFDSEKDFLHALVRARVLTPCLDEAPSEVEVIHKDPSKPNPHTNDDTHPRNLTRRALIGTAVAIPSIVLTFLAARSCNSNKNTVEESTSEPQPSTDTEAAPESSTVTDETNKESVSSSAYDGQESIDGGEIGDEVEWHLYQDGALVISGTGTMDDCEWDYDAQKAIQPWYLYHDTITSIIVEDGVKNIGECAFRQCSNAKTIQIPKSVTSIGWCAFNNCARLEQFVVDANNIAYTALDGVLFNKAMTVLIKYPSGKLGDDYAVPDGVEEAESFEYADFTNITFPDSLTVLGGSAFSGCDYLSDVKLPTNLKSIPSCLFWGNDSLQSVTIPTSVKSIADDAFYVCDNLSDIYYLGTKQQWNKISIGKDNSDLHSATIHFQST